MNHTNLLCNQPQNRSASSLVIDKASEPSLLTAINLPRSYNYQLGYKSLSKRLWECVREGHFQVYNILNAF